MPERKYTILQKLQGLPVNHPALTKIFGRIVILVLTGAGHNNWNTQMVFNSGK